MFQTRKVATLILILAIGLSGSIQAQEGTEMDNSLVIVADPLDLKPYEELVGKKTMQEIYDLAARVKGKTFLHMNATAEGGGVAEILHRAIPFLRALDIDAQWHTLKGTKDFFEVTKKMHNTLQGKQEQLTPREMRIYDEVLAMNAKRLPLRDGHTYLMHDPQVSSLIGEIRKVNPGAQIPWRNHIDTSNAEPSVWNFLSQRLKGADVDLRHMAEFIGDAKIEGVPVALLRPSIDPLAPKNTEMSEEEIRSKLAEYKIKLDGRPLITQISRFDPWKDPKGVIDTFVDLRNRGVDARLVLMGGGSIDDPEGARMFQDVQDKIKEVDRANPGIAKDIKALMTDYDPQFVNALQRASDVVMQFSKAEGFGLTATEAMWKEKVVLTRKRGGLKAQIIPGETGFFAETPAEAARLIAKVLKDPGLQARIGKNAKKHVMKNFLLTKHVRNYLLLMQPEFYQALRGYEGAVTPPTFDELFRATREIQTTPRRDQIAPEVFPNRSLTQLSSSLVSRTIDQAAPRKRGESRSASSRGLRDRINRFKR